MNINKTCELCLALLLITFIFLLIFNISDNSQVMAEEIDRIQIREDFQELLYDFDSNELQEAFSSEYLDRLSIDGPEDVIERQEYIAIEAAIADIEFLFKTFKYGYAGYQYFGGDEKFKEAKSNIIKDLESRGKPADKIKVDALDKLINSKLDFVKDNHFRIGRNSQEINYTLFYNKNYRFKKETTETGNHEYIEIESGHKFRGIDDYEIEDSIWPFIDRDGFVHYRPGLLIETNKIENNTIAKEIKLKAEQEYIKELNLTSIDRRNNSNQSEMSEEDKIYKKDDINGIPIIKLRSFNPTDSDQEDQLNQFLSDARELREYDQVIIDLRGNKGGSPQYAGKWLQRFTGRNPGANQVEANLRTDVSYRLFKNNLWQYPSESREQIRKEIETELSPLPSRGWSDIKINLARELDNDTDLIVLINGQTLSAGEIFIRYLRQLENITFIGSNTKGLLLTGGYSSFILNNSGIRVGIGTRINFEPDLKNREGRGYLPDYWLEFPENLDEINFKNI